MSTVALIGGDGAGKTTIANLLKKSCPFSVKYLYMGSSIISGNRYLPTALLARFLKIRALRQDAVKYGQPLTKPLSSNDFHYNPIKRGAMWHTLRLINRMAEGVFRKIISLSYQLRGYVVIYDRHFLFDAPSPSSLSNVRNPTKVLYLLEHWFFHYCYPKPDLVIFLDAPGEVLYRRKGEADISFLNKLRGEILERGKAMDNFVQIDATQPIEKVLAEVTQNIVQLRESRKRGKNICHR